MDVTDVLRDRMQEPGGLRRMATVSVAAHVVLVAALLASPEGWLRRHADEAREIMTITLGGGNEPSNGGMTAIGARPVQEVASPDTKRPEPVRPPAAKAPEMTLPKPGARPTKAAQAPAVKQAPDEARGRTPTRGSETTTGSAIAKTGGVGPGIGLSTGGAPGAGATLDVADFCCPDYLVLMTERIKAAWNQNQGVSGQTLVKFTIQRDGRLVDVAIERESGYSALDLSALRAVIVTKQLPSLPAAFPNPSLTVHLNFEYQR